MDVLSQSPNNLKIVHFTKPVRCTHCRGEVLPSKQSAVGGDLLSIDCTVTRVNYHFACYLDCFLKWQVEWKGVLSPSDKKVVVKVIKLQLNVTLQSESTRQATLKNLLTSLESEISINPPSDLLTSLESEISSESEFSWPPNKKSGDKKIAVVQPVRSAVPNNTSFAKTYASNTNKAKTFKPNLSRAKTCTKKVELKKSDLKAEIENILSTHDHSTITSKIVRTMLMVKFSVDLEPHKRFIDTTIMEIVSRPKQIVLKSMVGTCHVDEPKPSRALSPPLCTPVSPPPPELESVPLYSDLDSISPMDLLANAYDSSSTQTPINLCQCCLCPFRVHNVQELSSLARHIKDKHQADTSCAVCEKSFEDVYALMLHVAGQHRTSSSFTCKQCDNKFEYHTTLAKHAAVCFAFEDISDIDEESEEPPEKRVKYAGYEENLPGMVDETDNTLSRIQDFLDAKL